MTSQNIRPNELYLHVIKRKYEMRVIYKGKIIKSYPVVFGLNPEDDKLREYDFCTPEGDFIITCKVEHDVWSKYICLNYPNAQSWKKHKDAKKKGKRQIPRILK
jgi:murein L,D-transpeptidase YafK